MKRKIIGMLMVLIICFTMTVGVFAEGIGNQNEKAIGNTSLLKIPIVQEEKVNNNNIVTPMGPAPPLTYLQVRAAISTNYPQFEFFEPHQLSSIQDHGGQELYVITYQIGYSNYKFAEMNGALLDLVKIENVDLNGDSIIDGFYYWWDASEFESGDFTYKATSSNYPWNTMSDRIYIR